MFPQLERYKDLKREAELRDRWYAERALLDIFDDDPTDVIAFVMACDGADLHQFNTVHGLPQEVAIFRAILAHPKCDRATALDIFAACEPAYFDRKIEEGLRPADLEDEEDQVMLQVLMEARNRLRSRESWRGRYTVSAAKGWTEKPETYPGNLKHFDLSPATLRPTQNQPADSEIIYEYSIIGLSFEAWRSRH